MRNQNLLCLFFFFFFFFFFLSEMLLLIWMKFGVLPQPFGLLKLMLNIFCTNNIQGRELCCCNCVKYTFHIILCQDTCEAICFKLDIMLNVTTLYSVIPVWMTLMFTQCHRVVGKLELVQSLCCKVS